jgi:hypothetical protein
MHKTAAMSDEDAGIVFAIAAMTLCSLVGGSSKGNPHPEERAMLRMARVSKDGRAAHPPSLLRNFGATAFAP